MALEYAHGAGTTGKKLAFRGRVGRTVTRTSDPSQDRVDRFGRLLRYVIAGGVDLGRSLVSSGWARTYVFQRGFLRVAAYRRSQASARAAERGAWRACGKDFHRALTRPAPAVVARAQM